MAISRMVEVIDRHGRTADGGLVLDKECVAALGRLLMWRGHGPMGLASEEADKLGEVIERQLGIEFPQYT